ncbi:MAG: peptidase rane alanine aminopeptidase [Bacteroidetes bacterium]|nr:peptidase rane alanine aminopeptidase [Bacteroidota bacterium]
MPLPVKYFCICIVSVLFSFSIARAQVCHSMEPGQVSHNRLFKTLSADSIGLASTDNYDIVYHRISVKVDPAVRYIQGSVTSYFRPLSSLAQISFDLTDSLAVDSIYYAGARLATFTHSGNALTITYPHTIAALDSVVVYYSGSPPKTGFGSFNLDVHDSIPVLWTLSEPYGARDWLPCKMTLTDKVDSVDFYINVPTGNRAASNGLLTDSVVIGNTITYHWRHRYPIAAYLMAIGVTNYSSHSFVTHTQYGDIMVLDYAYPENEAEWELSDSNAGNALQLYSDLFGAYPFIKEKYGHAEFGWGGGMEHQTMSFVYNTNFELVNHEMAHQWFGDKLTCDSWSEIWLNEGFAVFLAGLCYERILPQYWYSWRQITLKRAVGGANGTVLCDDTNSVPRIFDNSLTYSKGAYLLQMLRWQLGDNDFFAAIKSYITDPALIYSFSKTTLLKAHLEAQSGQDLTTFFQQWFYDGGYPSYALDWSQQGTRLSLKLSQASSNPAVSFYRMPVPVKFIGQHADTTLILDHTASGQEFRFDIPFAIDSVIIDPELWLISDQNTVRKLPAPDQEDFVIVLHNPVHDDLTVWYDSKNYNHVKLNLYNMSGQVVLSENIPAGNGDYYSTAVSPLPAGIYVVKVSTEKTTLTQRVLKF